jgi:hypothetical protein
MRHHPFGLSVTGERPRRDRYSRITYTTFIGMSDAGSAEPGRLVDRPSGCQRRLLPAEPRVRPQTKSRIPIPSSHHLRQLLNREFLNADRLRLRIRCTRRCRIWRKSGRESWNLFPDGPQGEVPGPRAHEEAASRLALAEPCRGPPSSQVGPAARRPRPPSRARSHGIAGNTVGWACVPARGGPCGHPHLEYALR